MVLLLTLLDLVMEAVWAALLFFDAGQGKRFPLFEKICWRGLLPLWRGQNCKKALHSGEKCAIIFFTCKGAGAPIWIYFSERTELLCPFTS